MYVSDVSMQYCQIYKSFFGTVPFLSAQLNHIHTTRSILRIKCSLLRVKIWNISGFMGFQCCLVLLSSYRRSPDFWQLSHTLISITFSEMFFTILPWKLFSYFYKFKYCRIFLFLGSFLENEMQDPSLLPPNLSKFSFWSETVAWFFYILSLNKILSLWERFFD